jgi:Cu+-exporting ATPase
LKNQDKIECYHCGEDCGKHPVIFDEKPFCCHGCKTVYEILKEGDACEYYSIDEHPGIKIDTAGLGNKFAYLDNDEIRQELLDFTDGGISKVKFFVPSIHCSSCIWLLENLHRLHKGIVHSSVNFVKKEVSVTFSETAITLRQVVELLASINYLPQITLSDLDRKQAKKQQRKIYYQLGVAGFCFMNVMLFSFPDYLAGSDAVDDDFIHNFAYFNLILSIPVVFYAGLDYYISAFKGLNKKIINIDVPIALGISVLFLRSAWDILTGTGPGYLDSLTGLVFFLLIGKWYQGKTYQALSFERDYKSYFPVAVTVRDEDGAETTKPLKHLKIGDRIVVRNQELVPADAILLDGNASIDYSFVSGESTPVAKKARDRIFAGGRQIGSAIELIVEKEVVQSYLTELWNQDLHGKEEHSNLNSMVNVVSRYFTIAIILIAVSAGTYWYFTDPALTMQAFTAVLIVACPCALALTIPFAFGNTMRIFGRKGFYLKKTEVLEDLSGIDTVVFDKTGTITCNDEYDIDYDGLHLEDKERSLLKSLVRHSSHPLSQAIYHSLGGYDLMEVEDFREVPAQGIAGVIDGKEVSAGSEEFIRGLGQLSETYSSYVFVAINHEARGFIRIRNKYRPGLTELIGVLKEDYELHLLSGDNAAEKPFLVTVFGDENALHFRQSPKDKLSYIRELKQNSRKILMVGDGLNDAGALKESHVGITIADNVYHFSPACDAILDADRFNLLHGFIHFARTSKKVVFAGFTLSFIYNIIGISFAASGLLTPLISAILMPLSSVSVVAFATLTTSFLAKRSKLLSENNLE